MHNIDAKIKDCLNYFPLIDNEKRTVTVGMKLRIEKRSFYTHDFFFVWILNLVAGQGNIAYFIWLKRFSYLL